MLYIKSLKLKCINLKNGAVGTPFLMLVLHNARNNCHSFSLVPRCTKLSHNRPINMKLLNTIALKYNTDDFI